MRLRTLVLREIFERKSQLLTSFLAILLGITVIVSIKNISHYSEMAVAQEMDSLGANVLVLPKSATLQDYYAADMQGETIPEEYVTQLAMSDLAGLDNISPKLSLPVELQGKTFTLTGILPKSEFQAKAAWGGAGIFSRPIGCGASVGMMGSEDKKTLARKRVIETLEDNEVLVGADVAAKLGLKDADKLERAGQEVQRHRRPAADRHRGRFPHLRPPARRFRTWSKKGPVINAIEVIGCCQEISKGLVEKINRLLPDAKVVTITQIADSQIKINRMMSNLSLMFLVIIIFVGGASIANYMYANVFERRREIGTLMALGADSRPGAADLPAEGPDLGRGGRNRRLRAGHDPGRGARPEVGRRRRAADAAVGLAGDRHFRRPDAGGQLLPRPACRPARPLCHIPGGLIHVENGKRQQDLPASRPNGHGPRRRNARISREAISSRSSAPAAAARARCC